MSENIDALVVFLKERYDKDEIAAKYALQRLSECTGVRISDPADGGNIGHMVAYSFHARRHDPARALREAAAGRAIIAMYENPGAYDVPGDVIVQLGTVFNDHPDYRPSFTPEGALNA